MTAILEVNDLRTTFRTDDGIVKAVDGVSFSVEKGKTLGIVGESGSGKSVTCLTVMGLNDKRSANSTGSVLLDGQEILHASAHDLQEVRGTKMAMIFQDPMTSLNPVKSIGWQLSEAVLVHNDVTKKAARTRGIELLRQVGIPRAEQRVDDYPHQFSGGMRQRVMIAMGLINNPDVLIADEPTTALDVTTQAQILRLMKRLQDEYHMAIVMITHDLGRDRRGRRRRGRDVRRQGRRAGERRRPVRAPQHPYTWGLLGSLPRLHSEGDRLEQIPGQPPSLLRPPPGARSIPAASTRSTGAARRSRR